MDNQDKMYNIAKHLGQLNKKAKVKCFSANEKGYAIVKNIKRGCTISVYHRLDDKLVIQFLYTITAYRLYKQQVDSANFNFEGFFKDKGFEILKANFQHAIDENHTATIYFVDISKMNLAEITPMLDDIKAQF